MRRFLTRTATCSAMAASACANIAAAASAEPATTTTKPPKITQTAAAPKSIGEMVLGLCTRGRHVFLTGSIDDESAKVVIAQLMFLEQEAPGVPIRLHISSGGGKVQPGFAIHDVMHSITSPVHTICLGHCESMAAVLLAAGEPGHRAAMANSRIMIHQPRLTGGGTSSTARQLAISAASIERSRRKLAVLLAERTGKPLDEVLDLIEYDHVMDAQEALALGLIDVVITKPGEGFMAGANESAAAEPTSVNAADAASNSSDAA
jgi:ATP-dependent Clp protease protease subunit